MVNIEIDGIPLSVDPAKMIIQVADEAGISIPRFCYHKKLSIAANCRMCLVEVDKARNAVPACATPVTEGMKIFTKSAAAVTAQRAVMEFLLINHPLDCPICDQGGECELQDMSVAYGNGIGRFSEGKRVVTDKNIGPLIHTDMTRCIHCTRCVRFGEEIAGIKELGATGRGEHMEIASYIEASLGSELSGNIIDLCPVGALTSKPFRYQARAWELTAHPSIAPHDAVGSNIEFHTRSNQVLRVVPRDNESLNESWLADRDRFSYLALDHQQRATTPLIKQNDQWQTTDWQTALQQVVDNVLAIKQQQGADQIAGLIAPSATLEEHYLFSRLLTELAIPHCDYRLRQQDFADQEVRYSEQDWSLTDIADNEHIVLIGCNIRSEQPIIAHRIRQAALMGATAISEVNFFKTELLIAAAIQITVDINGLLRHLLGVSKALMVAGGQQQPQWQALLSDIVPSKSEQRMAEQLSQAATAMIVIGDLANQHPDAVKIRSLTELIANLAQVQLVILPAANSNAAKLATDINAIDNTGFNAQQCWQQHLAAYLLFGFEPEYDCADPLISQQALRQADFVAVMHSYVTDEILAYADVILPIASFAETAGTFIGVDGSWQSFTGAVVPKGESRPGWKVLRVLANLAELAGFDYVSASAVAEEVREKAQQLAATPTTSYVPAMMSRNSHGLMVISEVPAYRIDSVVRRSEALQNTPENQRALAARIHPAEAQKLGLVTGDKVRIQAADNTIIMPLVIDNALAEGSLYLAAALPETSALGAAFSQVQLSKVVAGD